MGRGRGGGGEGEVGGREGGGQRTHNSMERDDGVKAKHVKNTIIPFVCQFHPPPLKETSSSELNQQEIKSVSSDGY